jgi:hypothetical protein
MNTSTDTELYCSETTVCIENYGKDNEKRFGSGGDTAPYLTRYSSTGDLFRACLKQCGRCISKMYVGEDKPKQVGWVFFRKSRNKNEYDLETWVEVFLSPPEKRVVWTPGLHPTFKRTK